MEFKQLHKNNNVVIVDKNLNFHAGIKKVEQYLEVVFYSVFFFQFKLELFWIPSVLET